jgi:hypothetical protein
MTPPFYPARSIHDEQVNCSRGLHPAPRIVPLWVKRSDVFDSRSSAGQGKRDTVWNPSAFADPLVRGGRQQRQAAPLRFISRRQPMGAALS